MTWAAVDEIRNVFNRVRGDAGLFLSGAFKLSDEIVHVDHLTHRYGSHVALSDVSLSVQDGEIFGFLGPNGSGKTTLFRVLSTLIRPQEGTVRMMGLDIVHERAAVRRRIGVVFQSPSLDKNLTARENLMHHGHLYHLRGAELHQRMAGALAAVNLVDRADERIERFSGGMRRRVELAKSMLNRPTVLLLDEPSTGLDPSARIDLWAHLKRLQSDGVTILLTTHLMDEADRCSRLAILDHGKLVACDTPAALKDRIGGDVITLTTESPAEARALLRDRLGLESDLVDGTIRIERRKGHELVPQLIESLPAGMISSVSVGKPTLEDVFILLTGHQFQDDQTPHQPPGDHAGS
jgi:ABC-2 type transport system ATP-binding protein